MASLNAETEMVEVTPKTASSDTTTRVDPPHRTAASPDFERSVYQNIFQEAELRGEKCATLDTLTENSVQVAEQLRTHANQLATHLQQQQQDLDERESRLHAQMADQEQEQRAARLHLAERTKQLEQRSQQLEKREKTLEDRVREAEDKVQLAEANAQAAEEAARSAELQTRAAEAKAKSAEHEARAAEIRKLEAETRARAAHAEANVAELKTREAESRIQNSDQWIQLSKAMSAPPVMQQTSAEDNQTDSPCDDSASQSDAKHCAPCETVTDLNVTSDDETGTESRPDESDFSRKEFRVLSAELIKKKEILNQRSEALDQREAEVDQLQRKVMSLHKETLETRLVTEELWIRISGRMSKTAMTRSLAQLRTKMTEYYRLASEHLAQKERELESLSAKLNEGFRSLERQKTSTQESHLDLARATDASD